MRGKKGFYIVLVTESESYLPEKVFASAFTKLIFELKKIDQQTKKLLELIF
jgi:hypothetical protein